MADNFKYASLTQQVIGSAMTVHRHLGGGNFNELIYQRALMQELLECGIRAIAEKEVPVFYKGEVIGKKRQVIGKKRLDILVEDKVLVEIKALSQFEKQHFNQIINYLNLFRIEVGLLLNFSSGSLQFKRFVNSHL